MLSITECKTKLNKKEINETLNAWCLRVIGLPFKKVRFYSLTKCSSQTKVENLSSKNLKGGELEKLPKVKRQTSKQTYNPEQHSEFIDTPENLMGGKVPKNTASNKPAVHALENTYKQPDFNQFLKSVETGFPSDEIAKQAYDLFKNKNWKQLEQLFTDNNLNGNWPPNRGATGTVEVTLKQGSIFDRYGGWIDENGAFQDNGTFAGKDGTPYTEELSSQHLKVNKEYYNVSSKSPVRSALKTIRKAVR